jgi:hypothetical protein
MRILRNLLKKSVLQPFVLIGDKDVEEFPNDC